MADGGQDPSDWLQGFLSNDQIPSNHGHDQGLELHASAVFAEAARVAQQEHEAYLRFQRTASRYQSQQASHEHMSFWPPLEDAQSESLAQSRLPYVPQSDKQHGDAPNQQHRFVRPSDINPWGASRPVAHPVIRAMGAQPKASQLAIEQRQSHTGHRAANQGRSGNFYGDSNRSQATFLPSDNRRNSPQDPGFRLESFPSTSPKYDQYTSATRSTIDHPPSAPKDSRTAANSSLAISAGQSQARAPTRTIPEANPRPTSGDMTSVPRSSTSGLPEVRKPSAIANAAACSPSAPSISATSRPPTVSTAGAYSTCSTANIAHPHPPSSRPPVPNVFKSSAPSLQSGHSESPQNRAKSLKQTDVSAFPTSTVDQGHPPGHNSVPNSTHLNSHLNKPSPLATSSAEYGRKANQSPHQGPLTVSERTPTLSSRVASAGSQVAGASAPSLAASEEQATDNHGTPNQSTLQSQKNPLEQAWNKSSHIPQPAVQKVPNPRSRRNGKMPEALHVPKKIRLSYGPAFGVDPQVKTFDASKFLHVPASRKHLSHRPDLAQPLRFENAIMRETYNPATIAHDVLISSGRHKKVPKLNEHLEPLLKNTMVNTMTDLDSVRWDILDPIAPSHRPLPPTRTLAVANRDKSVSSPKDTPNHLSQPSPLSHAHPPTSSSIASASGHPPPPPPPPRTSALAHQLKAPAKSPATTKPTKSPTKQASPKRPRATPSLPSPSRSSPRKAPQPSPRSQGYPQPQVVIISPRKMPRGRRAAGGLSNGDSGSGAASPKSTAEYQIFSCKWSDCQSELHNLSSLQSHILKAHIPRSLTCGWAACKNTTPMSAVDHWEHVLAAHIRPMVWTLGDGPRVSSPANGDEELLRFPSTDLISRSARSETVALPADKSIVASFTRGHATIGRMVSSDAVEEGLSQWKEQSGPVIDPNDEQLSSFIRLQTAEPRGVAFTLTDSAHSNLD